MRGQCCCAHRAGVNLVLAQVVAMGRPGWGGPGDLPPQRSWVLSCPRPRPPVPSLCGCLGDGGRSELLKEKLSEGSLGGNDEGALAVLVQVQEGEAGCFSSGKRMMLVAGG